jgi:large exoprotein involved in heme utilization and adhesion
MALSWCRECLHLGLVSTLGLFGVSACLGDVVLAQIIPDTTLGTQNSQVTPISPNVDLIRGGATRGVNLFHSFQEFQYRQWTFSLFF